MSRKVLTYSALDTFRNCRRKFWYRYVRELVPIGAGPLQLRFGSIVHDALETYHKGGSPAAVRESLESSFLKAPLDKKQDEILAVVMMDAYIKCYGITDRDYQTLQTEAKFEAEIVNPATGSASRSYTMAGKKDAVVRSRRSGAKMLMEHKTASYIDQAYLEKLWMDFQILLYSRYHEQEVGERLDGVLYNVLTKAKLKQSVGETEEEFATRHADLCSKNKSGKSAAVRKIAETNEEFAGRLAEKYLDPGMFHRAELVLSRQRVLGIQAEVWELTQALLSAHRGGINSFYQNTSTCWKYGSPCAYWNLCLSEGSLNVEVNLYMHKPAHEELSEVVSPADEALPF